MSAITIFLNGRDYAIACDPGQEEHLQRLAEEIDGRLRQLTQRLGQPGQDMLLVVNALTMADEMQDVKREMQALRDELAAASGTADRKKLSEMERAISLTIGEIAARIEKIAERAENE